MTEPKATDKPSELSKKLSRILVASGMEKEREDAVKELRALEQRVEGLEIGLEQMKRWASGVSVHTNPQVILDAVVRMCEGVLTEEEA